MPKHFEHKLNMMDHSVKIRVYVQQNIILQLYRWIFYNVTMGSNNQFIYSVQAILH